MDAIQYLLHLHSCEQEGITSGMPTPQQWIDAVEAAREEYNKLSEHSALKEQWISVETPPIMMSAEHRFISILITLNSGVVRQGWFNTKTNHFQTIGHDVYDKESITHYMITPQPPVKK